MSFVDFFRPKWKHSDPEVRAEAVRDLENESQLVQVLRGDEDARVRRIALKKIADADVLAQVAESDSDDGLRRAAAEKASEIFLARALSADDEARALAGLKRLSNLRTVAEVAKTGALDSVRKAALARLSDDRNLTDVGKNAREPAMRRLAIERIHDSQALRDIAIAETVREVGIAAVEQIQETAVLEQVAKRAKNKQVAQAARDRLPQAMGRIERTTRPPQEVPPEARRRARQAQLTRELEQAIGKPDLHEAEHAVAEVKHAWAEVGVQAGDEEQKKKFDKVLERFAIRKRTIEKAVEDAARAHHDAEVAQHKRAEEEKAGTEAREALCARVEAIDLPAGDELKAAVEAARAEWQGLPRLVGPKGKELEIRFRKATESSLRRAELSLSKVKLKEKLEAVVAEAEALTGPLKEMEPKVRQLRRRLADLEAAGFDDELRARFRKVEERVEAQKAELVARRAAEDEEAQKRLEEQVGRLEALPAEADRKKVEHELKVVASAFESTKLRGPALNAVRERYTVVRDKLAARAQELRDAENWKRWANVPQLEKLCTQMETIARALANEQHVVVKGAEIPSEVSTGTPEGTNRYPEGYQQVPAEVSTGTAEVSTGTAEVSTGTAEVSTGTAEVSTGTAEVSTATPVVDAGTAEAAPSSAQEAEPAAPRVGGPGIYGKGGRVDYKKALAVMKVLQAEWKTVGPAPKERSEQLWQRFKIAGDEVYHRTHTGAEKAGEARAVDFKKNVTKKEELIAQVEALVAPFAGHAETPEGEEAKAGAPGPAEWKETAEKIKALQEEWKKSGPVSRSDNDALWKRFRGACDQFFGKRKEISSKASEERSENLKKLEELCARVEGLADSPDFKRAAAEIKAAQAEWKTIGPAPRSESDKVWKRFRAACDKFFSRRNTQFAEQDAERGGNLAKKEALCLAAEALVEKSLQGSMGDRDAAMKEAKKLQADWKKAGPVPREHGDAIWRRFRAACDKIFNPEEEAAAAAPEPAAPVSPESDPKNWPKFENKLPLAGVLAQIQGGPEPSAKGGKAAEPKAKSDEPDSKPSA